jgi:hypothetical protein
MGSKTKPVAYEEEESLTVELFRRGQGGSYLFASQPGGLGEEEASSLFAEALLSESIFFASDQPAGVADRTSRAEDGTCEEQQGSSAAASAEVLQADG